MFEYILLYISFIYLSIYFDIYLWVRCRYSKGFSVPGDVVLTMGSSILSVVRRTNSKDFRASSIHRRTSLNALLSYFNYSI